MSKFYILVSNNIRKNKGQYISFFLIIFITAFIFNLGIITSLNYSNSYDEKCEKYNAAEVLSIIPKNKYSDEIYKKIESLDGVETVEKRECINITASIDFANSKFSIPHVFFNMDEIGELDNIEIVEEITEDIDNPIYISYWLKMAGGYRVGDPYVIESEDNKYTFNVAGFTEDINYGRGTCGCVGAYLPKDEFESFEGKFNDNYKAINLQCKVDDISKSKAISTKVNDIVTAQVKGSFYSGYYDFCKETRIMTSMIMAGIFMGFALIILLVSLLVSNFKINNSIQEDMQNMGALKAIGYKAKEIINSIVLTYISISVAASILGICISYALLPCVEMALNSQNGLLWNQSFDLKSMLVTIAIILILTAVISYLSARKIKRLSPILALRGGIQTHNFKKNHFEIENTLGNVNFIIALKNLVSNIKQNILLFLVIIAVNLAAAFSAVMFYNINVDSKAFVDCVTEEAPSVRFTVSDKENLDSIMEDMKNLDNVKDSFYYDISKVTINGDKYDAFITEDFSKCTNNLCYEGRNPIHDNEIAIGNAVAKEKNLSVGDTVKVFYDGEEKEYLVCGLIQAVNYNGDACEISTDGLKRINKDFERESLYTYLENNDEVEDFIDEVMEEYKGQVVSYINDVDSVKSATDIFTSISGGSCVIILSVTAAIIILILYLIIKTLIVNSRQDFGILKSMGYTTKQLIMQVSLSFLPVIIVGTIVGIIISYTSMNSILLVLFRQIGVMKVDFEIHLLILMLIGLVIGVFSFLISVMLSYKIKKISAYSLIKE